MLCTWPQCSGCESPVRAGDATAARQWAGQWVGDAVVMARLRQLALAAGAEATPLMCDDHALAERITAGITAGSMRVCGPAQALRLYGLATVRALAPAPAASAAAAAPRAAPVAAPPPAATTFGPDLDVGSMVAALVQASQDGVPFCEECARAAALAAAEEIVDPVPAPAALPPLEAELLPVLLGWIEVQLLDEAGDPVPGEPWQIICADGSKHQGSTDARGRVRLDSIAPGVCRLTWPGRDRAAVVAA